ncbi:hypothetical protein [Mycolicibacterium fortuitum]|uniref:hypothetical protein n=1 Tax=Mycolicibacterium fortuitum TaxID=1766 RepID=UPI002614E479|nr:hypothetical protein [Mycolicibacterium fortuitum]
MANRKAYYVNESFGRMVDGQATYDLVVIEENVPGYWVSYSHPDLETLQLMADESNMANGLSREDLLDIVVRSVAAGPVRK